MHPAAKCNRKAKASRYVMMPRILMALMLALFYQVEGWAQSEESLTRIDAPSSYTVVEGDTLWNIAVRFLNDPWRWQEIWQANASINNPDLIYPGDLLILSEQGGRPVLKALRRETVRLEPRIYSEGRAKAIPAIDPAAIQAFIRSPLIVARNELSESGYVVSGTNETLIMGKYDQVYVRAIEGNPGDQYRVFRPGKVYQDIITGDVLGQEARHIADLRLLRHGDESSKMTVLSAYEELAMGDRLRAVSVEAVARHFYPSPAPEHLRGHIVDVPSGLGEAGPMATVVLNLGLDDAVEAGAVFRIYRSGVIRDDPVAGGRFKLPEEAIGLVLVYRTFERLSFALITDASQSIRTGDTIISPGLLGLSEQEARFSEWVGPKDSNQRKEKSLWKKFVDKVRRN
jgi:hypothetical protein